jgi:hypothetical protein
MTSSEQRSQQLLAIACRGTESIGHRRLLLKAIADFAAGAGRAGGIGEELRNRDEPI